MEEKFALGMIETKGLIGLIEAADAAVKAAKVLIVDYERTGSGLGIIKFRGSVGAVKAALEAGARAAQKVGQLIASHVIPNPDEGTEPMIKPQEHYGTMNPAKEFHRQAEKKRQVKRAVPEKIAPKAAKGGLAVKLEKGDKKLNAILDKMKAEGLDSLDYNEIRYFVRRIENFPMAKGKIRNAGRGQLLDALKKLNLKIVR